MINLLEEELSELKAKDLYRKLRILEKPAGNYASYEGRKLLLFCGNDYLGLSKHPRVIRAAQEAAGSHGVGAGAARLISGTTDLHSRLEEKIAASKKKERALLFTAGYLANLGILTALASEKDLILMDKLCHASIIDGARLSGAEVRVFPHKNYERCEDILKKSEHRRRILVSDTVFSMDGDVADLPALVRLKEKYDCLLCVDDAHGTGVLGKTGKGAAEDLGLENKIDVIMGTFSKGLGCLGGFAATSETIYNYLINFARPFIFATALPPLLCAAAFEALCIIEEEPGLLKKLWANIYQLQQLLGEMGYSVVADSPILPIGIGPEKEALRLSDLLLKEGILIPAVRTPTVPKGKARLRVTLSAAHTSDEISRLGKSLKEALKSAKSI